MFSETLSSYILDTMCAARTDRQQQIAQSLLNRFNNLLEQRASLDAPKTNAHKVMVLVADRLAIWLDKNVRMSKEAAVRLKKLKEMEEERRLLEEKRDHEKANKLEKTEGLDKNLDHLAPDFKISESEKNVESEYESGWYESEEETPRKPKDDNQPEPPAPPPSATSPPAQSILTNVEPADRGQAPGKEDTEELKSSNIEKVSEQFILQEEDDEGTAEGINDDVMGNADYFQLRSIDGVEGSQNATELYSAKDFVEGYSSHDILDSSGLEAPPDFAESFPSWMELEKSGVASVGYETEPSKDSATLLKEIEFEAIEGDENEVMSHEDDEMVDEVLKKLAAIIADTPKEHTALQEAIKDVLGKELEEKLGDKHSKLINHVAGKVGTWVEKTVEKVQLEYGVRRSLTRARSMPLPSQQLGNNTDSRPQDLTAPQKLSTVQPPSHPPSHPPVSQKPKGPIFKLRKIDTDNVFSVKAITHTKAKQKIREARGHSSQDDRLDFTEWAEWAGLVSEMGQNWAKWIGDVTQDALRSRPNPVKKRLSDDAKEWRTMNKTVQREGEAWTRKVMNEIDFHKVPLGDKPKAVSA